ncbi:LysR substrate-binding domain-containing protein [Mesorhizobium sp. M0598]|uniref:LysR substrate-binding domain-containing protein n=1 Tax=Mesorhizobium sp. M0598 TaxID=2956968 RepID=UPI00333CA0BA
MPKLAASITPIAPSVILQMMDHPSTDVFGLLSDGKADIVLDRVLDTPEWIASRKLFRSWLVCIARRGHPLLSARGIRPAEAIPADVFCAIPQVLRSADGRRTGTIDPALEGLGLSRRSVACALSWATSFSCATATAHDADTARAPPQRAGAPGAGADRRGIATLRS